MAAAALVQQLTRPVALLLQLLDGELELVAALGGGPVALLGARLRHLATGTLGLLIRTRGHAHVPRQPGTTGDKHIQKQCNLRSSNNE